MNPNPLLSLIQQRLKKNDLSFTEFMQLALYEPQYGYYTAGLQKFGAAGDFITAPELTPLFGQTLANQCYEVLETLHAPVFMEFGAGSGRLCIDILKQLETMHALPNIYYILEVSGNLHQRQKHLIQEEIPHLFPKIQWLNRWPEKPFEGIILANEVLDAMPITRFMQKDKHLFESYISLDEQGALKEIFKPCSNQNLKHYLDRVLPKEYDPYLSEANLFIDGWIAECAKILDKGLMLLIDYGFPRQEYYHPERNQGTLICHYRHKSHMDPLIHIGEQDITAHVDFTHVAEAALEAGFQLEGFSSQAAFLLGNGILDLMNNLPEGLERVQDAQALKQLLQAQEMGELFKVIGLSKNLAMERELRGFTLGARELYRSH